MRTNEVRAASSSHAPGLYRIPANRGTRNSATDGQTSATEEEHRCQRDAKRPEPQDFGCSQQRGVPLARAVPNSVRISVVSCERRPARERTASDRPHLLDGRAPMPSRPVARSRHSECHFSRRVGGHAPLLQSPEQPQRLPRLQRVLSTSRIGMSMLIGAPSAKINRDSHSDARRPLGEFVEWSTHLVCRRIGHDGEFTWAS